MSSKRSDVLEVRQDQIDARLRVLWEQHAAVNDEQTSVHPKTVMLRPISPRPPRATIRNVPDSKGAADLVRHGSEEQCSRAEASPRLLVPSQNEAARLAPRWRQRVVTASGQPVVPVR